MNRIEKKERRERGDEASEKSNEVKYSEVK